MHVDNLHIHIHTSGQADISTDRILRAISGLARTQGDQLAQGARVEMISAEVRTILDQMNTFTNTLATEQAAQGVTLAEIGNDLDALIANTNDPELRTRLEAHRDALAAAAGVATQHSNLLTELAARHEAPIPPLPEPTPPPAPEGGQG